MPTYVAVDLGATSGRVVNVHLDADDLELDIVSRFANQPMTATNGDVVWDFDTLFTNICDGLVEATKRATPRSVAIDSWAVDYGLLDATGKRLGPVHAYRSPRTTGVMERILDEVGRARLYAATGIQFLPFNTVYQLAAARESIEMHGAAQLLMVPDLINHELCGSTTNEVTNASSTQLLDAFSHEWSEPLITDLDLRRDLFPPLHEPGTRLGVIAGVHASIDGLPVVAAASHDTASAVAGTPLRADRPGIYISCGTWSLVGCELASPITSAQAMAANVTNELGVGGTTRLLKNVTGLWLLEECRRAWSAEGVETDVVELAAAAAAVPGGRSVIDPDDPRLAVDGPMTVLIAFVCASSGQVSPKSPAEFTRVILDSLALAWRRTVGVIERISGIEAEVIHLVGGGSANRLLAELCASACGRSVLVGPTEATVIGNALVQAIADGVLPDLAGGRALVERALPPTRIEPGDTGETLDWSALESRLSGSSASR